MSRLKTPVIAVVVLAVQLVGLVLFNAVPELIYLGHYGVLALLARAGRPLSAIVDGRPPVHRASRTVPVGWARKGAVMREMVERAKGLLMAHRNLTEDEAYRTLRGMAMSQNKRLVDIAEAVLAAR